MGTFYYKDLILLPNQEVSAAFLMGKVISVLHLICVEDEHRTGSVNTGIGFPGYNKEERTLGNLVRLFAANPDILHNSSSDRRLLRLDDYLKQGDIQPVPDTVQGYVQYRRVQFKENKERLVRRYAKRHNMDIKQAMKVYADYKNPANDLPYVTLDSLSSGQRFRLYINEVLQTDNTNPPVFNNYGLTKSGFLPYFDSVQPHRGSVI